MKRKKTDREFLYLKNEYPRVSESRINEGIFVGFHCFVMKISLQSLMKLKIKTHDWHLREFARSFGEITNHITIVKLCQICRVRCGAMSVEISFLESHIDYKASKENGSYK